MSASIEINKSKFVIFGAGHDYTLADSGEGEKVFFSHPFVPLNSVNYAGQYYFLAPIYDPSDETADPVFTDVVKDDIAHCTFDPALGTTFDTEGEVTVKVTYYREYIYPESTIVVEKELEQKITVVDHGTVANSYPRLDVYSDGYGFIHPNSVNSVESIAYSLSGNYMTKCSSVPWRATKLGNGIYGFLSSSNLTDISELAYVDLSNVNELSNLFTNATGLSDISALKNWDVSNVRTMNTLFHYNGIVDLKPLSNWDVSKVTVLSAAFSDNPNLKTLEGLEKWDVSSVTDMRSLFANNGVLDDISALENWDVSNVTNMYSLFAYSTDLRSLHGLEKWDVSKVANMQSIFIFSGVNSLLPLSNWRPKPTTMYMSFYNCSRLQTLKGIEKFDLSGCTSLLECFYNCDRLLDIEGVEDWDVSECTNFNNCFFNAFWVSDLSPVKDWDLSSAQQTQGMFGNVAGITDLDGIIYDLSNATNMQNMFAGLNLCYASDLGKLVRESAYEYVDYNGNTYSKVAYGPYPYVAKDANEASNWTVSGTGKSAFDSKWSNIPSWN